MFAACLYTREYHTNHSLCVTFYICLIFQNILINLQLNYFDILLSNFVSRIIFTRSYKCNYLTRNFVKHARKKCCYVIKSILIKSGTVTHRGNACSFPSVDGKKEKKRGRKRRRKRYTYAVFYFSREPFGESVACHSRAHSRVPSKRELLIPLHPHLDSPALAGRQ